MNSHGSYRPTALQLAFSLVLGSTTPVRAWGGWNGGDGSGSGGSNGGSSSGFGGFDGSGNGFGSGSDGDFDVNGASRHRAIHGILGALAFVVLFPLGSILMRLVPGRFAIWIHGLAQVIAYIVYIAAAALGFLLVQEVQIPFAGGNLLSFSEVNYHPIIGIVVLVALFFQPFLGVIHHSRFKKLGRRQVWSHLHLWNGRLMIPLGIINGGLGLRIAGAPSSMKIAYAVIAAVMVAVWLIMAVLSEVRRGRRSRRELRRSSQLARKANEGIAA